MNGPLRRVIECHAAINRLECGHIVDRRAGFIQPKRMRCDVCKADATRRTPPNLSEKLAAALLYYLDAIGDGILHEHAKLMSTDQILSLFNFDHWPKRVEAGGTNHPSNLKPLFIGQHRIKTAKKDQPEIAKGRRLRADEAAFRARLLAKEPGKPPEKRSRWPSRPFPKRPLDKNQGSAYNRGKRNKRPSRP